MYIEETENIGKASSALGRMKVIEKGIKFHKKNIGNNTTVYCKNKERIKEFEETLKIKIV